MTDYAALFKASVKTTGSDIFERVDKERQIEAITREEDKVLAADMQRALDAADIAAQAERQRQLAEQKEAQESRLEDARREEEEVAMIRQREAEERRDRRQRDAQARAERKATADAAA